MINNKNCLIGQVDNFHCLFIIICLLAWCWKKRVYPEFVLFCVVLLKSAFFLTLCIFGSCFRMLGVNFASDRFFYHFSFFVLFLFPTISQLPFAQTISMHRLLNFESDVSPHAQTHVVFYFTTGATHEKVEWQKQAHSSHNWERLDLSEENMGRIKALFSIKVPFSFRNNRPAMFSIPHCNLPPSELYAVCLKPVLNWVNVSLRT